MHQILREMDVPDYFFPQSKHTFSNHQLITLLVLRQYESKSYRSFVQWLEAAGDICDWIGLQCIPHHTTLQKASARIDEKILQKTIGKFIEMVDSGDTFGIDASGLEAGHATRYYTYRAQIRRGFVKISLCSDMKTQIVCASVIQNPPVSHDVKAVSPLLKQIKNIDSIKTMVLDKGYDSEAIHVMMHKRGIRTVIPVRRKADSVSRVKGKYRKQMYRSFDQETYNQRNKTETIFSVTKRMFGPNLLSRNVSQMKKEALYRILAYNCHRMCQITDLGVIST